VILHDGVQSSAVEPARLVKRIEHGLVVTDAAAVGAASFRMRRGVLQQRVNGPTFGRLRDWGICQ
jgi:hypothetical protein